MAASGLLQCPVAQAHAGLHASCSASQQQRPRASVSMGLRPRHEGALASGRGSTFFAGQGKALFSIKLSSKILLLCALSPVRTHGGAISALLAFAAP